MEHIPKNTMDTTIIELLKKLEDAYKKFQDGIIEEGRGALQSLAAKERVLEEMKLIDNAVSRIYDDLREKISEREVALTKGLEDLLKTKCSTSGGKIMKVNWADVEDEKPHSGWVNKVIAPPAKPQKKIAKLPAKEKI